MMPSLAHVLLKRRSALSKDSFSLTFTSDMNFPPSRCEIRVRERLTFFTVHLGIIHKKTALVNKNKRIEARKFDFSANFGFPDQKAEALSLLLFISRQRKNGKIKANPTFLSVTFLENSKCSRNFFLRKQIQPESVFFELRLPYSLTSGNQFKACFHAFFFSVFLAGVFSAFASSVTFLSSTTIPRGGTFTRMLFW